MRIAGNHEKVPLNKEGTVVTNPYKLPRLGFWNVSVKRNDETIMRVSFMEKSDADVFRARKASVLDVIRLPIINESGKTVDEHHFFTLKAMNKFIKQMNEHDVQTIVEKANSVEASQTMMLEDMVNVYGDTNLPDVVNADTERELEELEEEYQLQVTASKNKAKNLLFSIAEYYLGSDMLTTNNYVIYKLQLEEASLSSLIFQLDVSKKAIYSIIKQIHLGNANVKLYDSLASLQRIILDVNKYQSSLIKDMTADFKNVKLRQLEIEEENKVNGSEDINGTVVYTTDRNQLMKNMRDDMTAEEE